ncbi:hypothetical protein [Streptomyces fragilis]|uniref:Uncharacterized protein n=1 Tax=Streptomyces fragilis TaxID=67301 RepID=A0ABV2YG79_9ACTN|nr:hypothetical protein [Streptomyces fragilis]
MNENAGQQRTTTILTTHNLATLVARARVAPREGWAGPAAGRDVEADGGRRFLGWTVGPHRLLEGMPRPARR